VSEAATPDDLIHRLDAADALLDELAPKVTAEDLAAERSRGGREPQQVRWMLVSNYGHAREHLAHIELTQQLYGTRG
jgi:hypothetical protein